jgi:hypothetical protein
LTAGLDNKIDPSIRGFNVETVAESLTTKHKIKPFTNKRRRDYTAG